MVKKMVCGFVGLMVLLCGLLYYLDEKDVYSGYCTTGESLGKVYNYDYTNLGLTLDCKRSNSSVGFSGLSVISSLTIEITAPDRVGAKDVPRLERVKLHEATHMVEYLSTKSDRKALYASIGVSTDGKYPSIETYKGPMDITTGYAGWRANQREQLAQNVVFCVTGVQDYPGMKTIEPDKCPALLQAYSRTVLAAGGAVGGA